MGALTRSLRALIVLVAAGAVAVLLVVMKAEPEKEERKAAAPLVEVKPLTPQSKVMAVQAFGTVKPRKAVNVTAEAGGRITYVNPAFVAGGFVAEGEIVAGVDKRSYRLDRAASRVRIRQAQADIERLEQEIVNYRSERALARKNRALSEKEVTRLKNLSEESYASQESLDKAEMASVQAEMTLRRIENSLALTDTLMKQKKAALDMARVDLDRAELALEKTDIKAGFDAYVINKTVEKDEFVGPGSVLGRIYQKGRLDVDVRVPLEKMKWIDGLMEKGVMPEAQVRISGPSDAESGPFDASVVRFKAHIDEKTRTIPMTLEIDTADENSRRISGLKPGTFVRCRIKGETYDNLFVVPRHLLNRGDTVFTVENGALVENKVGVLRRFKEHVYVNEGLAKGDSLLHTPLPGAVEGMHVTVRGAE